MSSGSFLSKMRSAFRKDRSDWDLSDTVPFEFSDELAEEDGPKFNKLRVVVSGEMSDYSSGVSANGVAVNTLVSEQAGRMMMMICCWMGIWGVPGRARTPIIGGYVSNSLAIMTDAVHMLTDVVGILFSLLALWLSTKPPTKRYTFGLHRLGRGGVCRAQCDADLHSHRGVLVFEAVQRTMSQDFDIDGDVMLITAAVGVAVNLIMGFLLNQGGHLHGHSHGGHSHGHSHSHSPAQLQVSGPEQQQKSHGSLAVRAAFIHALGDLLRASACSSQLTSYDLSGSPVSMRVSSPQNVIKTAPLGPAPYSLLVLCTTFRIIRDTVVIVLEGVPRHLDTQRIREDLLKLEDVQSVDELNVWALTSDKTAALVHLQLTPSSGSNWEEVQSKARQLLLHTYGLSRCTVQIQTYRQRQNHSCTNCLPPNA
ncbi:hypothetical protein WMY93_013170 [Mugilogobius chulae]|uniref:Solute carrier family 30 member 4 n=1 Tax=Mugilogobius chulae TaxID=88201 RepID=A0AAW0P5B1_9GOBI